MKDNTKYVGLDVSKEKIAVAVADEGREEPRYCIGFLLTIFSINLIPIIQKIIGWEWVFTTLAIGPILGIYQWLNTLRIPKRKAIRLKKCLDSQAFFN